MTILITGGGGNLGNEVVKLFKGALVPSSGELDIRDREKVFAYIREHRPEVVLHMAALTGIRECEDTENAWSTNVIGTQNIVEACLQYCPETYFVYVSTACVFYGDTGLYNENSVPHPKNYYALTKLIGEFVVKRMQHHTIARTNFVAKEKWKYPKAFADRYGTYLFADGVALGLKEVIDARLEGVVHITGDRKMSMYELAKITTPDVQPMTMDGYSGPPLTVDMTLDTVRWKKYRITGM
jgi:dTDP-4-dehydrorhamnose reductase